MRKQTLNRPAWAAIFAFSLLLFLPLQASAEDQCADDSECAEGFLCTTVEAPCAGVACDPDPDGEVDCPDTPPCEHEQLRVCTPAPPESCQTDSDCAHGLICHLQTFEACDEGAPSCPEGDDGCEEEQSSQGECVEQTVGQCAPAYLGDCEESADCGPGFECKPQEECSCSDSPGVEPGEEPDGGSRPEQDCECYPSDYNACELIEQRCDADNECAGDLVCLELAQGNDSSCAVDSNGESTCDEPDSSGAEAGERYCAPHDYERWTGVGQPTAPGSNEREGDAAGDDDPSSGGSGEANSPEPGDYDQDESDGPTAQDDDFSDDGCGCASQSSGAPTPGALAIFTGLLFGLLGARQRLRA